MTPTTSTPTTLSNTSCERRESVGSFYSSRENPFLFSPLLQETHSNFFLGDFLANQSFDASSSFQQISLSSEEPSFGQYIQVKFIGIF